MTSGQLQFMTDHSIAEATTVKTSMKNKKEITSHQISFKIFVHIYCRKLLKAKYIN